MFATGALPRSSEMLPRRPEVLPRTADAWADRIRPHLTSAVEEIVAAGRDLVAARDALPHGEFTRMVELLGMGLRTAERFMAIARHPVLSDRTQMSILPPSWGTLYELSRIEPLHLVAAIESGRVAPSMERREAHQLSASVSRPAEGRTSWLDTPRPRTPSRTAQQMATLIEMEPADFCADPDAIELLPHLKEWCLRMEAAVTAPEQAAL